MFRSVLYLRPKNGEHDKLIDYFKANRVLETAAEFPGCLSAELQIPEARSSPALVTALWSSAADYSNWVNNPWRATSGTGIHSVLADEGDGDDGGLVYRVEIAVASESKASVNP